MRREIVNAVAVLIFSLYPLGIVALKKKEGLFTLFKGVKLPPDPLLPIVSRTDGHMTQAKCSSECLGAGWDVCKAVNYQADLGLCTLLPQKQDPTNVLVPFAGNVYMEAEIVPRSCLEWYSVYGSTVSGSHVIDPDGPYTGLDPFTVTCDFQENPPMAKIYHDKASFTISGYEPNASFQTSVTYDLTLEQILSVINASTSCRQFLKVRCIETYFFGSLTEAGHNIYWTSRDGERMLYWGGGNPNGWGCACGVTNSCVASTLGLCNCNTNDGNYREDEGYVTDSTKLPVSKLNGGDTGGSSEQIDMTVGPLECVL